MKTEREQELENILRAVLDIHDAYNGKKNRWSKTRLDRAHNIFKRARELVGPAPLSPIDELLGKPVGR